MIDQDIEFIRAHDIKVSFPKPEELGGIVDFLASIEGFRNVPRSQLEWLARESSIQHHDIGTIFNEGEVYHYLIILLEGEFSFYVIQNNQKKVMATWQAGAFDLGLLPFSRMKNSPGFSEVLRGTKVLALHDSKFRELMQENYELTEVFVHALLDRVRMFTSLHFQNEKLMSLGKLSAGLAHELNNPAAAIGRSADDIQKTIDFGQIQFQRMIAAGLGHIELEEVAHLMEHMRNVPMVTLQMLKRKQLEGEIREWLESNTVMEDCSDTLVDFGYSIRDLNAIKDKFSLEMLSPLFGWMSANLLSRKDARKIAVASKRISDLVQSVKSYTRMDQMHDMQELCINDGIRNTLTMLLHKVESHKITLLEDLAESLPLVHGFPGELNQVWNNIIDNSLDAMQLGGELVVKTSADREHVFFTVIDSGTGIAPEDLERIFDPFFTTKDVGEGTGVGLDIVQKVVQRHRGSIVVNSRPGRTEFAVSFPINSGIK